MLRPALRFTLPLLVAAFLLAAPAAARDGKAYQIEISVAPAEDESGGFYCTATVSDLDSGQVLAAPRIFLRPGDFTGTASTLPAEEVLLLEVGMDTAGTELETKAEIRDGDVLLARQTTRIRLP